MKNPSSDWQPPTGNWRFTLYECGRGNLGPVLDQLPPSFHNDLARRKFFLQALLRKSND
ncbi:MAG: hypothetical protein ACYS32_07500 [Planctomycetota bacterium]|jgi:hypothetical protein